MGIGYDIIGDIAIIKFDRDVSENNKKIFANNFLLKNKNIKTILEKTDKIKGRLRIAKTKFIAGEDKRITIHNENYCKIKLNVDKTYFSSRLSNERKVVSEEIIKKIKNNGKILVMFAGVAPFPLVIARFLKNAKKKATIISNEINREACKYAEENIKLNKLEDYIKVIQCDAKKLPEKRVVPASPNSSATSQKFDFIMMARPNLKETFLKTALKLSKKSTIIYYHGFGEMQKVLDEIKKETKNKISKIKIRKAGEIAPFKYRWNAKFAVR